MHSDFPPVLFPEVIREASHAPLPDDRTTRDGHGTISYQGTEQTFCVHGLSLGEVAAASLKAEGLVFNLNSLKDFSGRYFAISAGVALVHGESAAMLKNERGVTMQLETKVRGLRFNIATSGLRIALAGEQGCAAMQAHQ